MKYPAYAGLSIRLMIKAGLCLLFQYGTEPVNYRNSYLSRTRCK